MPRYDYRIRRNAFRNGDIEKHMDFRSIENRYRSTKRIQSLSRFVLILIALIILIGLLVFTSNASQKQSPVSSPEDHSELKFKETPEHL